MGIMLLKGDETPREIICLAYGLEEGMRKFYSSSIKLAISPKIVGILSKLAEIEVRHKQRLFDLYLAIDPDPQNPEAFEAGITSELIEGGFNPDDLLEQRLRAVKSAAGVLDFAMMLEAQAMDLYMRYAEKSEDPRVKGILFKMADEEKAHLKSLGNLLEENVGD